MPRSYPSSVRRQVALRLHNGEPVAEIAKETGISAAMLFLWKDRETVTAGKCRCRRYGGCLPEGPRMVPPAGTPAPPREAGTPCSPTAGTTPNVIRVRLSAKSTRPTPPPARRTRMITSRAYAPGLMLVTPRLLAGSPICSLREATLTAYTPALILATVRRPPPGRPARSTGVLTVRARADAGRPMAAHHLAGCSPRETILRVCALTISV